MTSILNQYIHDDGSIALFNGASNSYQKQIIKMLNQEDFLKMIQGFSEESQTRKSIPVHRHIYDEDGVMKKRHKEIMKSLEGKTYLFLTSFASNANLFLNQSLLSGPGKYFCSFSFLIICNISFAFSLK